jgi:hypothetical protein
MQIKRLTRTLLLTAVWTYAAATWASISHHLFGMPDLVVVAAVAAAMVTVAWSLRPRLSVPSSAPARLPNRASVTE